MKRWVHHMFGVSCLVFGTTDSALLSDYETQKTFEVVDFSENTPKWKIEAGDRVEAAVGI